jgi:hypothetical protein
VTTFDDLPTLILKTAAEACGVPTSEVMGGRDTEAVEARRLAVWLLNQLTDWEMEEIAAVIGCTYGTAADLLRAASSRRRRDPVWREKCNRLRARLNDLCGVDDEEPEPQQLDLLAPVDTSSQPEPCCAWGFEEPRGKRYFIEANEKAMRAFKAGLEQEAKEREQAA